MAVTVTPYSAIECVIKTTVVASVDLFSIDSSTLAVTSSYLPQSMQDTIKAQAGVLRGLVGSTDFPTVLPTALPRLLTASPLSSIAALALTVGTVGTVSTLTVSGLSNPCWFLAAAAHSITGGFNTDRGTFSSGGGGGSDGSVPAPGGPYVFAAGTPLAVNPAGTIVAADAGDATKMPAIGFYNGAIADTIQVTGVASGLVLVAGSDYYIAIGGGVTATPPSGVGVFLQRMGRSLNATDLFVTVSESIENP
jgi:hypothetical protein